MLMAQFRAAKYYIKFKVNVDWNCNWYFYFQSVFVEEKHRRKGAFTALFNYIDAMAKKKNSPSLRLYVESTNEVAKKTYVKLGMKR